MSAIKRLGYFPLEPLQARYTELLSSQNGWAETVFEKSFKLNSFRPTHLPISTKITKGEVLDAVNRPVWALEQVQQFLLDPTPYDRLYIDDIFHPGIEAIPYSGKKPEKVVAFCWAQTFDRFDFTRSEYQWMRPYEFMAFEIVDVICVASELLADLITTVNPSWENKIEVTGLPFNSRHIQDLAQVDFDPTGRSVDIVYTSRLDEEKQAFLLPEIVESFGEAYDFVICTGHDDIRSNIPGLKEELERLEKEKINFHILRGLTKAEYYGILSRAKIQLNTALQDWVSFTLLEALTFGCVPMYPMYRSFVEEFASRGVYCPNVTYPVDSRPEDIGLRLDELMKLLSISSEAKHLLEQLNPILAYHDNALEKISNHLV